MGFIGKLLGFIVGYRFAGFFGGLAGAFLGHLADKKLYELGSVNSSFFKRPLTRQSLFMQSTFAVLGHLSKAKGRVTEQDIKLASQLMDRLRLDDENRQLAQTAFQRGKDPDFPLREVIREFRIGCGQRNDLLRMFFEVQVQAVIIDGDIHPQEKEVLYAIGSEFGMNYMQIEQMLAMAYASQQFARGDYYQQNGQSYQGGQSHQQYGGQGGYQRSGGYQRHSSGPTIEDAYKVLGVSADDDRNVVKRAYRRLMNEHHPDKLVAKGLPPEMMDIAKEKAQQIQAAYDLICKIKGWK